MEGERPDTVPWAPNIHQWFYAHQSRGTLPGALRGCGTPIDALRWLGAEVLTRWDGQIKGRGFPGEHTRFRACTLSVDFEGGKPPAPLVTAFNTYASGTRLRRTLATPCGTLRQTWRFAEESHADFEEEYWWKDFEGEYEAVRAFIEDRRYDFDTRGYEATRSAIGESGFVVQEIPESPLKMLHWLCGPEQATLWLMDHGERMRELFKLHTRRTCEFVQSVLDRTDVLFFISNDNLDARLFPPCFFETYLLDHYRAVAEIVHSQGAYFWVHSCGNTYELADGVRRSGIDCLEGLTPPPLGNFPLDQAHVRIGPHFVVEGGNSVHEQEVFADDAPRLIREHTEKLFRSMRGHPRFIYASSCNTSIRTPWRNIAALRDAARELGRTVA